MVQWPIEPDDTDLVAPANLPVAAERGYEADLAHRYNEGTVSLLDRVNAQAEQPFPQLVRRT